ncbi:MAG: DNA-3-methyladenine glycosylase 2 family protein [Clostridia bacterium]|nr:DNA-3-methyladenine glycosylase 2 family protein [Clostridia bacterium]
MFLLMISFDSKFFNITDTLDCGQVFRFMPYKSGFLTFALDKVCYAKTVGDKTVIESDDDAFWRNYFDLDAPYETFVSQICGFSVPKLTFACQKFSGIRILNQSPYEALVSFIVSQNNNIPRIKSTIEKLCLNLGKPISFNGEVYHAFPTAEALASADERFFKSIGAGYRAEYLSKVAADIVSGKIDFDRLSALSTDALKSELLLIKGVGNKVADCAVLFGFHRMDAFPVDTWIEKLYVEDFGGTLKDRKKISEYFVQKFGDLSGLAQQYLFHAKRKNLL